jgi:hypothetical protein
MRVVKPQKVKFTIPASYFNGGKPLPSAKVYINKALHWLSLKIERASKDSGCAHRPL